MKNTMLKLGGTATLVCLVAASSFGADGQPWVHGHFRGRVAYSCDGNHNDPDDWIASPVTLAILAEAGLKDRLVHFDYNSILHETNPEWEKTHAASVLGAAERYGFDESLFYDCRKELETAIASIARAVDQSSADNPLYFIIAGPVEVPYLGIQRSDPAKRPFVYCISHSRWNDGFASHYKFRFTKRSVIEQNVHWVQISDQNRLLSTSPYGRTPRQAEWGPYYWMRDSLDPKVAWLWDRMQVSTRPDPSDAGMTWFLVTGDEESDPAKLKGLIAGHHVPWPRLARAPVRLESENFRHLEGFVLEDRNDRNASHRLSVKLEGATAGRIRTQFDEPFTLDAGRYDVEVRYLIEPGEQGRLRLLINDSPRGPEFRAPDRGDRWATHTVPDLTIKRGDEIAVEVRTDGTRSIRLDYVQLNPLSGPGPATGLLRVHPTNPRYFTDGTRTPDGALRAVYLTGSRHWNNLQDSAKLGQPLTNRFDYEGYLAFLKKTQP